MLSLGSELQSDLSALVLMMGTEAIAAYETAIANHYLSVNDLEPRDAQGHLLRFTYLLWCKLNALPYVAVCAAPSGASVLLDLRHVEPSDADSIESLALSRLGECAASVATDSRCHFIPDMPPDCAAALATQLYKLTAGERQARRPVPPATQRRAHILHT